MRAFHLKSLLHKLPLASCERIVQPSKEYQHPLVGLASLLELPTEAPWPQPCELPAIVKPNIEANSVALGSPGPEQWPVLGKLNGENYMHSCSTG